MSNKIVAEIHSAFDVAEEQLLTEARSILNDAGQEDKKKRAEALSRMGFGNAAPVRRLSPEELKKADELLFLKSRYERIAPQYRFITEEKLLHICKKYGIVVGSSERYYEDIPEKNQEDIANFKVLDESFLEVSDETYRKAMHRPKSGDPVHPKDMGTDHIINTLRFFRRNFADSSQRGDYMSASQVGNMPVDLVRAMVTELALRGEHEMLKVSQNEWRDHTPFSKSVVKKLFTPIKTTYFYVAANIDSFDTKGVELKNNQLVEKSGNAELEESMKNELFREYDPIVLAKVQGGYLIVTAWGAEASDEDVLNPNNN